MSLAKRMKSYNAEVHDRLTKDQYEATDAFVGEFRSPIEALEAVAAMLHYAGVIDDHALEAVRYAAGSWWATEAEARSEGYSSAQEMLRDYERRRGR